MQKKRYVKLKVKRKDYTMFEKKNKINQDTVAMIIADWEHGEWTECDCECKNCPLIKELPINLIGLKKLTICNALTEMSVLLNQIEVEYE